MAGHIKLDRRILDWEWYQDANTCRLFIHLLLEANYKDGKWQGNLIKRGQLITGLLKLNEDTGLTIRQLRTSFDKLKMTGEITIKTTNKFRVVTICKYDTYQSIKNDNDKQTDSLIDNQTTSYRQTNDKQATTNNKENNNKEEKEEINRGKGDFQSPQDPKQVEAVFKAPDGSLVRVATIQYTGSDFNGLPDEYAKSIKSNIWNIKQIEIDAERLLEVWETFKVLEIRKKVYRDKDEVYSFFSNYCKKQTWAKITTQKHSPLPSVKKVFGIEFTSDFRQCKMNDGTIVQLTQNQQDSAKYNQINPNSIKK